MTVGSKFPKYVENSLEIKFDKLMNERYNKEKRKSISSVNNSSPNDLRLKGFKVAVHNDYVLNGEDFTFWLMTKKYNNVTLAFRGEGKTDEEALNQIREQVINFKE